MLKTFEHRTHCGSAASEINSSPFYPTVGGEMTCLNDRDHV